MATSPRFGLPAKKINRSKRPLVLLAGELVSGGKQDRVIAKDRIVAPGVYRWREITEGRLAQIELDALRPKELTLHRLKIHRTS